MFISKPFLGEKCEQSHELVFKGCAFTGKPATISVNKELKESQDAEQKS